MILAGWRRTLAAAVVLTAGILSLPAAMEFEQEKASKAQRQEDSKDYFKKWLTEDAFYIITDEESKVFGKLTTEEEKEQFIEQFWFRRDPDPRTPTNEFKQEHYRRIAYANERFSSGIPGWLTDRGRVYIIQGPPDEIESRPMGGNYTRPSHEGGGETTTYPFEVWRYRYIEGIGQDVELEFVDPTSSGEYRLALNPEEKDAMLHIPGAGLTTAEQLGLSDKADRPFFSPGNRDNPLSFRRAKDNPFDRYQRFVQVMSPQQIRYKDLKELVEVKVSYNDLPLMVDERYYRLNESHVLVPLSIQVENRDLTFQEEKGVHVAKLAVYGIVTSITNRIVAEFEDDLRLAYTPGQLQAGLKRSAVYQKVISLEAKMRYKVDLVVKDLASGHMGVVRKALTPPRFSSEALTLTSPVVSDSIGILNRIPDDNPMFVLGDVKVRPDLSNDFDARRPFGVYCQLYNAGFDQSLFKPTLKVTYQVLRGGETVFESVDETGESVQLASGQRIVLIRRIPIADLAPGRYTLRIEVEDRIKSETAEQRQAFSIRG